MATKIPFKVRGQLVYCNITGNGKLNVNSGKQEFVCMVKLSKADAQPLIYLLDEIWKDSELSKGGKLKAKHPGYIVEEDQESGEETGNILFRFKTSTEFDGKPTRVKVFRANGKDFTKQFAELAKMVASESEGIVFGNAVPFNMAKNTGISLYLSGVQFTKFVEYKGMEPDEVDVEDDGFDDIAPDDGFEAEDNVAETGPEI